MDGKQRSTALLPMVVARDFNNYAKGLVQATEYWIPFKNGNALGQNPVQNCNMPELVRDVHVEEQFAQYGCICTTITHTGSPSFIYDAPSVNPEEEHACRRRCECFIHGSSVLSGHRPDGGRPTHPLMHIAAGVSRRRCLRTRTQLIVEDELPMDGM